MPITDLPGYYPEIKDGGLGVLPPSLAGLFCLVGTSESGSIDVRFAGDANDLADEYGLGTILEHGFDAFAAGAVQMGVARAIAAKVATDITVPVHKIYGDPTGGGEATFATGYASPHTQVGGNREFRIRIIKGGSFDTATYQVSLNGGLTWGAEKRFVVTTAGPPRKAKLSDDFDNGTYIEFTEAGTAADSFTEGDEYRWWCYEPRATLDEIIAACERAVAWKDPNTGQGFEYIYVASLPSSIWGTRDKTNITAFWAAMITIAEDIWDSEQRPVWFIVNSSPMHPMKDTDPTEELADWQALLVECSAAKRSTRLCVNAASFSLTDSRGQLHIRQAGGTVAGLVSGAPLHHSIGYVREMAIPNAVGIYPNKPELDKAAEALGTGDGTKKLFEGFLAKSPVVPWTVVITSDDTAPEEFVDGGDGILYDSTSGDPAGTIDYDTGKYGVTFTAAPAVSKIVSGDYRYITHDEMDKNNLSVLNDARYITGRHWIGYGLYITDDWMMAPATSDYYCIRNRRIVDEAVRQVGIANTPYINSPGITESDMAVYKADLSRPLEAMKVKEGNEDKPVLDYKLTLTPDANIWSNGIVNGKVEIVPNPTKKKLEAVFMLKTRLES